MIKIVKNVGQCKHFAGTKHRYLLSTTDFDGREYFASISLRPLIYWIKQKIKK